MRSNLSLDPSHNGKRGLHQEFCSVFLQVCADKGVGWPPDQTGRRKRRGEGRRRERLGIFFVLSPAVQQHTTGEGLLAGRAKKNWMA